MTSVGKDHDTSSMTVAKSRLGLQIASAVLLTLAVFWMIAPTYPMEWLIDPSYGEANPVTYHSWLDPMVFGYGGFHAPVTALCGAIAAIGAWLGVVRRRPGRTPSWWALAGVALYLGWLLVLRNFLPLEAVPLVLLTAGAGAGLLAARRSLPPVVSEPAAR